jgi:hypothetical protein
VAKDIAGSRIQQDVEINGIASDRVEGLQPTGYPRFVDHELLVLNLHERRPVGSFLNEPKVFVER